MKKRRTDLLQIDGHPLADRVTEDGKWRPNLNERERNELKRLNLIRTAIEMLPAKDLPEIADELGEDASELASAILYGGNEAARKAFIDKAIEKILDLEQERPRQQMAKEMGLTRGQLDKLMKSDDFRERYAEQFEMLRADPNIETVRQAIVQDLLPTAFRTLRDELAPGTPWSIRQKARQDVMKYAGIGTISQQSDDRAEALRFLSELNVTVNNNQISIQMPPEYQKALEEVEAIEGEVVTPELPDVDQE